MITQSVGTIQNIPNMEDQGEATVEVVNQDAQFMKNICLRSGVMY